MQVLSRGSLLPHPTKGRSKAWNVAKSNLSEVKHKTMLASGLRSNRMWGGLKAFSGSQHFYSAPLVVNSFCMSCLCLCRSQGCLGYLHARLRLPQFTQASSPHPSIDDCFKTTKTNKQKEPYLSNVFQFYREQMPPPLWVRYSSTETTLRTYSTVQESGQTGLRERWARSGYSKCFPQDSVNQVPEKKGTDLVKDLSVCTWQLMPFSSRQEPIKWSLHLH